MSSFTQIGFSEGHLLILQACLNGARPATFHPRLPVTISALVEDAQKCAEAGADELHLHVRGNDGFESLAPSDVDATVAELRAHLPGKRFGISTGGWILKDDRLRLQMISGWTVLPDYASVNLKESGAPELIRLLFDRGIGVEAGLATVADAERLLDLGLQTLAMRSLIEIEDPSLDSALALASRILAVPLNLPVLVHGWEHTVWPFAQFAFRNGFSTRVGLEDGATLPDGSVAQSNAELIAAANRLRPKN